MSYRELLQKYKAGELPEEQRKQVRQDIEKQDAISEYLFDNEEMELEEQVEHDGGQLPKIQMEVYQKMDKTSILWGLRYQKTDREPMSRAAHCQKMDREPMSWRAQYQKMDREPMLLEAQCQKADRRQSLLS